MIFLLVGLVTGLLMTGRRMIGLTSNFTGYTTAFITSGTATSTLWTSFRLRFFAVNVVVVAHLLFFINYNTIFAIELDILPNSGIEIACWRVARISNLLASIQKHRI